MIEVIISSLKTFPVEYDRSYHPGKQRYAANRGVTSCFQRNIRVCECVCKIRLYLFIWIKCMPLDWEIR